MPRFFRSLLAMGIPEGEAVRRMTSLPASIFHLPDRGALAPGLRADLVLFNATTFDSPATFTTATVGIDDVDAAAISLYPNPATTTVTISGIEGQATVTVVDMNGREVHTQAIKHSSNQTITLDLTGYAQGAYFVRITGEQQSAIRKLIVK